MIGFCSTKRALESPLRYALRTYGVECCHIQGLGELYTQLDQLRGVVVDREHGELPQEAWQDLLGSLAKRIPMVILGKGETPETVEAILAALAAVGALGLYQGDVAPRHIPFYTPALPIRMLEQAGSMSLLVIQTEAFKTVALEYGEETYYKLCGAFQQFLLACWGEKGGGFRSNDFLCQAGPLSTEYYILLERSRTNQGIPAPGALEHIADRIYIRLQNLFWEELFRRGGSSLLPPLLRGLPGFSIGYASALYNPCFDVRETMAHVIEQSQKVSVLHSQRMAVRKRELLQNIVEKPGLLHPHYQGVFHLQGMPISAVEASLAQKSVAPLAPYLYASESLIRIDAEQVHQVLEQESPLHMEASHLKPDVLFAMAYEVSLTLELDQTCMRKAIEGFSGVPGKLLVNIVPRNFYHLERLEKWFPPGLEIIFEVSESEAIHNLALLLEAKAKMSHRKFSIAIDDFGMGFAGLERILDIHPEVVKLDRSLIENIHQDPPKQAYVAGLVETTKITHALLLAEGVETLEELKMLQSLGVGLVQGFLLHRPQEMGLFAADLKKKAVKSK